MKQNEIILNKMEDSNGSKPFMVTSSLTFQVNTPSFYNQPKKFASVAPPRPKGPIASTATVGRVGEIPPPPSSLSEDFPPPPPPVDAELPAPPPECQLTPPASEAPPPAFPPPPPVAEDLPLPAPPEDVSFVPSDSSPAHPPPPPPPPPPPAPPLNEPGIGVSLQKQTSFDRQLDSLTDMLSEMETRRPFNPKASSQLSSGLSPKPPAPPPTAPKPSLSFLPPPELQDRPPPAPWAEELRARTTLRQGGPSTASAPASGAPLGKGPAAAPKTSFIPSQPASNFSPKPANNNISSAGQRGVNLAPKVTSHISFPPPPAAPPGPPPPPANAPAPAPAPAFSNTKAIISINQEKTSPSPASPQPKPAPSPTSTPSPYGNTMAGPTPPKAAQPKGSGAGAPPTGVPLSMREVEELERMTKDFIKDMDNRAPVICSAPTEVCGKCGEALSRSQPAVRAMDKLFHSHCFCCITCHRPLQGMQFYDRDGTPECEECYVNSLAVCSRCGERITDRVLKAVGQCFHAHCFRCTACSCTLEGSPFITDDNNNPYCVNDYHRRFSPLCVSCNEPIVPDPGSEETLRVVALEKNFHLKCYRCELGGWPVRGNWVQPDFNSTLATLMSQYNTFPFFNVYVGPDRNGSKNYIQIDQPDFHFPTDWNNNTNKSKFNSQALRPFFASCKELLSLLNISSCTQHCGLYLSLSSNLVTMTAPLSYRLHQNHLYDLTTIQELQELAPAIDWLSCLQAMFHPVRVKMSDFVLLHNQPYIIYMSQTLIKWRCTHENMGSSPLHMYMIMNLLQTLMPALHPRFMQIMKNFSAATDNEDEDVPHWRHCVLQTVKGFDTKISHLIKDRHAGEKAENLISDIYNSLKTKIATLNWQNNDTQHLLLNKVGKTFELLNCDQHKNIIIKSGRDPGNVRPDITHQSLLMLMDSPLNRAGLLQVYIHTGKNALIEINPQTRIPRTFPRFCGLMVQLLHKLSVRAADGPQRLLRMIKNPVSDHLPAGCPRYAMSFKAGDSVCPRTLVPKDGPAVVVIGAFAHGA
ncbi:zyxin-like, partial [Clarias magur]